MMPPKPPKASPLWPKIAVSDAVQTSNESPSSIFIGDGRRSSEVRPAYDGEDWISTEERAAQYEGMREVEAKPR